MKFTILIHDDEVAAYKRANSEYWDANKTYYRIVADKSQSVEAIKAAELNFDNKFKALNAARNVVQHRFLQQLHKQMR